jgi:hypothetical protein
MTKAEGTSSWRIGKLPNGSFRISTFQQILTIEFLNTCREDDAKFQSDTLKGGDYLESLGGRALKHLRGTGYEAES